MPGLALGVPHTEIRVLAASVGQREAARQLGISENTVKSVCFRNGDGRKLAKAIEEKHKSVLHPNAPDAASVLQSTLEENYGKGRLGLSKWLAESAETLAKKKGDDALEFHQPAVSAASVLAKLCPPQAAVSMRISMFGSAAELEEPLTLEMEIAEPEGDPLDGY